MRPAWNESSTASTTPLDRAASSTATLSHAVICSASPARRAARANEPPINPAPMIAIRLNLIIANARRVRENQLLCGARNEPLRHHELSRGRNWNLRVHVPVDSFGNQAQAVH